MQFLLDKHSPLPVVAQLEEQVKIALMLGRLRPGDLLPSIREVEKQVGISRNAAHKAYLNLQQDGILDLHHGKGAVVKKQVSGALSESIVGKAETLATRILAEADHFGIVPTAFARFLYQRAIQKEAEQPPIVYVDVQAQLAAERASKISSYWQAKVPSLSIDELRALPKQKLAGIRTLLANYIRYDEVRDIVNGRHIEVIPVGLSFTAETVAEFSKLRRGTSVLLIFDERDQPVQRLITSTFKQLLSDPSVKFRATSIDRVKDLGALARSGRYTKLVISNRLWEQLPHTVRRLPAITRLHLEIDLPSLERARLKAGVIV